MEHAWKRCEVRTKFWSEDMKGRDHAEDLGVQVEVFWVETPCIVLVGIITAVKAS
jgi:predicted kinase